MLTTMTCESSGSPGYKTVLRLKFVIFFLGLPTLGVGVYAHFHSTWYTAQIPDWGCVESNQTNCPSIPPYRLCTKYGSHFRQGPICPHISKEEYFVAVTSICFMLSLALLITSSLVDFGVSPLNKLDMGYHILASVLLCVAGIVFTVSTAEIVAFVGTDDVDFKPGLLSGPKYFAGISVILLGMLYIVVAGVIFKENVMQEIKQFERFV